jgi:hypothetical protein
MTDISSHGAYISLRFVSLEVIARAWESASTGMKEVSPTMMKTGETPNPLASRGSLL